MKKRQNRIAGNRRQNEKLHIYIKIDRGVVIHHTARLKNEPDGKHKSGENEIHGKKAANSFMNTVIFFGAKAIRTKSTDIQKFIKTDSTFGILGKKSQESMLRP